MDMRGVKALIDNRGPFDVLSFRVERESVDVTLSTGETLRDEAWAAVDERGHFHAWSGTELPTLYPTGTAFGDDDVEPEYLCRICSAEVQPGYVHVEAPTVKAVPGRETWGLEVMINQPFALTLGGDVSVRTRSGHFGIARVVEMYRGTHRGAPLVVTLEGRSPLGRGPEL